MRKRLEGKSMKTAYLGLLLALAVICGYIEALIPVPVPVPGMKLGLANLVIAAVLYLYGPVEAITVSLLRVLIIGFPCVRDHRSERAWRCCPQCRSGHCRSTDPAGFSVALVPSRPYAGGACSRNSCGAGRQDRPSPHLCRGGLLNRSGDMKAGQDLQKILRAFLNCQGVR